MNIKAQTIVKYLKAGPPGPPGENGESAVQLLARPAAVVYQQGVAATYDVEWVLADGGSEQPAAGYTIPTLDDGSQLKTGAATQGLRFSVPQNGTMRLHVLASCAYKGCVSTTYAYNGKTYAGKVSVAPAAKGDPGQPGSVGATVRTLDWDAIPKDGTFQIYSGTEGEPYLDVVFYQLPTGGAARPYMCIQSHIADASILPTDPDYFYDALDSWAFISTKLIMAEYGDIKLMQTNGVRVFDDAGNLSGGMRGGTGAVLYISPRRRPVSASMAGTRATTGVAGTPAASDAFTLTGKSVASLGVLWGKVEVGYSDGSTTEHVVKIWTNNTGSSKSVAGNVGFACSASESEAPYYDLQPQVVYGAFRFSADKPALWCKGWVSLNGVTRTYGPTTFLATAGAGGAAGTSADEALVQLRSSGDAIFGAPNGRRWHISPSEACILAYGSDGKPAVSMTAEEHYDIDALTGGGTDSTTTSADAVSVGTAALAGSVDAGEWGIVRFVGSVRIDLTPAFGEAPGNLQLDGGMVAQPNGDGSVTMRPQWASATAELRIGGVAVANRTFNAVDAEQGRGCSEAWDVDASVPCRGVVDCTIALTSSVGCASARAVVPAGASLSVEREARICRYFANGFALGSASTNYCAAWIDDGGNQCFRAVNSQCGLEVTAEGVKINRGDGQGWVAL